MENNSKNMVAIVLMVDYKSGNVALGDIGIQFIDKQTYDAYVEQYFIDNLDTAVIEAMVKKYPSYNTTAYDPIIEYNDVDECEIDILVDENEEHIIEYNDVDECEIDILVDENEEHIITDTIRPPTRIVNTFIASIGDSDENQTIGFECEPNSQMLDFMSTYGTISHVQLNSSNIIPTMVMYSNLNGQFQFSIIEQH